MDHEQEFDEATKELDGARFRFENKIVHLTYSSHLNEAEYVEYMVELVAKKGVKIVTYSVVKENGKMRDTGKPHPHTHALFMFDKTLLITDSRYFDYKSDVDAQDHPHIKKVVGKKYFEYVCSKYHKKEGVPYTNYVAKEETKKITLEMLQSCKNTFQVAKLASDNGRVDKTGQYLKAWEHRIDPGDIKIVKCPFDLLKVWQQYLINCIEYGIPDDRVVHWIMDEIGGMGKSSISDYLREKKEACYLTTMNVNDALRVVTNFMRESGEPKIIIIDIARSVVISNSLYQLIEVLKGKNATSGKYDSKSLEFKRNPHIFVFSNERPVYDRMSMDRWIIYVPNYNGDSFDYSFEGVAGSKLMNKYSKVNKVMANMGTDILCIPVKQRLPITYFDYTKIVEQYSVRKQYWDRYVFPKITITTTISIKPAIDPISDDNTVIVIEEIPFTEKEISEYKSWVNKVQDISDMDSLSDKDTSLDQLVSDILSRRENNAERIKLENV